ncbi:MAG: hypothetical protein V3S01_06865 [Dehalococcoidia bacterium]
MRIQDVYNVRWRYVRQLSFAIIDFFGRDHGKGRARPVNLVQGVAVLFLLICARFKLEPRDVLEVAARVIRFAKDDDPQYVRAIEAYLREELDDGC